MSRRPGLDGPGWEAQVRARAQNRASGRLGLVVASLDSIEHRASGRARRRRMLRAALVCFSAAAIIAALRFWDVPSEAILIGLASGGVALGFTACLLALGEGWW